MNMTTNAAALERSGLTEDEVVALSSGPGSAAEAVDPIVLDGTATIVYVDREVARYLAMRCE